MNIRILFFLILVLPASFTALMAVTPEQLLKLKPVISNSYRQIGNNDTIVELAMDFNTAIFKPSTIKKGLEARSIKKVTLYYSVFRLADKFDQPELNLQRFKNLQIRFPFLFKNSVIEWEIVGQLNSEGVDGARKLFHGFVIEMRPSVTPELMAADVSRIERFALSDSLGRDSVYEVTNTWLRKRKKWTGYFLPRSMKKRQAHVVYTRRSILKRNKEYMTYFDTVKVTTTKKQFILSTYAATFAYRNMSDSTVTAALNRNIRWKNMVFVVDVTGSMSPYSNQLFVWYKLNSSKRTLEDFIFFNDGDTKSDRQKTVGKTGGLYFSKAIDPNVVILTGQECMRNGGGGDAPENNCEALLAAQNRNPDAKELFMIADNWANMRDTTLIKQIKKPVHVILCGVHNNHFNTVYLDLARRTRGSIHTIDQDIENLMRLSEGEKIKLGTTSYIIRRGKFELLREL